MNFFDVFNGDADGLSALHQLRLLYPRKSVLVTGVKRDVQLLFRISCSSTDSVTVIDISLDSNRKDLLRILDSGARVEFFDHHYAGEIPTHKNLITNIDESPFTCSSLIVNSFLKQRFPAWAIAGAFGDGLIHIARKKAAEFLLSFEAMTSLQKLGELFNYNSYGDSIQDLFYPPEILYHKIESYEDPLEFIENTDVLSKLEEGYNSDLEQTEKLRADSATDKSQIFLLPDERWARRVRGNFANGLANKFPEYAIAVLTTCNGRFVVSVRTPARSHVRADEFCRKFPSGGGRARAAGISELPVDQFREFEVNFHQTFSSQKNTKEIQRSKENYLCKQR